MGFDLLMLDVLIMGFDLLMLDVPIMGFDLLMLDVPIMGFDLLMLDGPVMDLHVLIPCYRQLHDAGFGCVDALDPSSEMLKAAEKRGVYRRLICSFFTEDPIACIEDSTSIYLYIILCIDLCLPKMWTLLGGCLLSNPVTCTDNGKAHS